MPRWKNSYFSYLDKEVISQISGELLLSPFPMEGNVSGHHRSPHKGSSVEFAEYREYTPGEDPKRMDWRVFGRTDKYFLKEFEAETNLRCHLALDCSASMSFGETESKLEYAKKLSATLAYIYLGQGDAVGLHVMRKKNPITLPPKRNPSQVQEILQILGPVNSKGETNLSESLHEIAESSKMRGLVIIVSDFFEDIPLIDQAISHLKDRKHDVILFQLLDQQEIDFEFTKPTRFVDLEGEGSIITQPILIRDEYRQRLEEHSQALLKKSLECGATFFRVPTKLSIRETLDHMRNENRGGIL